MSYFENLKTFIRVFELGSMSAAARDQRISPAVASSRIAQLEERLGVRLFQRTTRKLGPTEQGRIFYEGAQRVLDAVEEAESAVNSVTGEPRGTIYVAAPLGLGRRFIAPQVPAFKLLYPKINIRLRLSDRKLDLTSEGLDIAFFLGTPEDSTLKMRKIADCERLLCAAPTYIASRGAPTSAAQLTDSTHDCLNLRYPGAPEFQWPLQTSEGLHRVPVTGPYESDDGDVLTTWALEGHGIILKPRFEVAEHLTTGALVPVLESTPPLPVQLGALYSHRKGQDPKTRLFTDFIAQDITAKIREM
ncbi:LysR family transcriptional regulator [Lentibacter algarum]|uniref:LysR family transcriptional regulator n=1 Tax=Lentibacter algarum TaxID=576131 RepID=UPI001C06ACDC|nr:LysR family transcriptional regulator [Lentibacter algarum]MBU2981291.1 LysR family transcriptional regulator [Lentibacter algarum]